MQIDLAANTTEKPESSQIDLPVGQRSAEPDKPRQRTGERKVMRMLHLSALPVWPIEGKGGMPSLRETLHGHVRGGHSVVLVLPRYQLFADRAQRLVVREDEGYEVRIAPCRWAPALLAVRRIVRRLSGGQEPLYPLRWLLNASLLLLLTVSLGLASLRIRFWEKKTFDLVYAHNQYAALAGWLTGRVLRIPNVTRLYGTFLADLMNRPLVWLRYPTAAAGYLVPHTLLICANDGTRGDEVARKLGIDLARFRFWQNGVDVPDEPPPCTREQIVSRFPDRGLRIESQWALSCSRISYWKRIDRMIRALRIARDRGADCQLLVAGSGSEEDSLRALARQLGIEDAVVWLGAVEHDTVWQLMHLADLFLITNDVTNRCNPVYEAICTPLPVVSVIDPSTADLLEHEQNALLADKDDDEALGEHLYRVCTEEDLAGSLKQAQAVRREQLWTWRERMAVEVAELEGLVVKG
jgi:glycosyltransferase involved in cell wall biosynthesis